MTEIHGRKFGTKNKTKCDEYLGKLPTKEHLAVAPTNRKDLLTCEACKKNHKPGKC